MSAHDAFEDELRGLAAGVPGDWDDVVRRARGISRARTRRRITVLAAAAGVLLVTGTALGIARDVFGWFSVSPPNEQAPPVPATVAYVAGQSVNIPGRRPQRLQAPVLAPLLGQEATFVVRSPDLRYIAYHSWRNEVPSLHVHDTATNDDRTLVRGAHSLAWSNDGRIAYLRGLTARFRPQTAYEGHVVVQDGLGGRPVRWTTRHGKYEVLAWARERLLVQLVRCLVCRDTRDPGVYELERSGRLRALGLASLVALSPDGRYAFGRHDPVPGQDSPSSAVRLVEIASGRVVDQLDLARAARAAGLRGLLAGSIQGGAWRGREIVATFSGLDAAVLILRVERENVEVRRVFRVPRGTLPSAYGVSFGTPTFVGRSNRRIAVLLRGSAGPAAVVLVCDRARTRCTRGRRLAIREWVAILGNPSRP